MIRRPPRPPLFPYTPLFRPPELVLHHGALHVRRDGARPALGLFLPPALRLLLERAPPRLLFGPPLRAQRCDLRLQLFLLPLEEFDDAGWDIEWVQLGVGVEEEQLEEGAVSLGLPWRVLQEQRLAEQRVGARAQLRTLEASHLDEAGQPLRHLGVVAVLEVALR